MRPNLEEWVASQQGKHHCHCGCGGLITVLPIHHSRGIPKYINRHYSRIHNPMEGRSGALNPNYKGGRYIDPKGYVAVLIEGKKHSHYKYEHRMVMERVLGRALLPTEIVHHINGNKQDNRPENLRIMTHQDHGLLHQEELKEEMGNNAYLEMKSNICNRKSQRKEHAVSNRN